MLKSKLSLNYKKIMRDFFILFVIFPFIQQRSYAEYPQVIWLIYRLWMIVSAICIICIIVITSFKLRKNGLRIEVIPLLLFFGIYILASVVNAPSELPTTLLYIGTQTIYVLFLCYEMRNHFGDILRLLSYIYGGFIYLNFLLDLLFPTGIYHVMGSYHHFHLLGDDNSLIYVMLPGVICIFCYSYYLYGKVSRFGWVTALLCDFSLIRVWSISAMTCMTLFIVLMFIYERWHKLSVPWWMLLTVLGGAVFYCFFGLSNPYVQQFITQVLQKSITLSGRTLIWNQAYRVIGQSWLMGHGSYWRVGQFSLNQRIYPCHTPYLQILIDGGVLLLIPFVVCVILAFWKGKNRTRNPAVYCALVGLTFMLINYITEHSQLYHFYVIFLLIIYSSGRSHRQSDCLYGSAAKMAEYQIKRIGNEERY